MHIARFKRPKAYVFLTELPKNNTGKVLKTALREHSGRSAERAPSRNVAAGDDDRPGRRSNHAGAARGGQ